MMGSSAAFPIGFREVLADQTAVERAKAKTFDVNAGGAQSTLQEIKLADEAGGFAYAVSSTFAFTKNRFICWRTTKETLELTETSLDYTLTGGSRVTYRFLGTPILSRGVSVHETSHALVVLVATVGSVHKLVFPHPRRLHKQNRHLVGRSPAEGVPSVFAEATAAHATAYYHVLATNGTSPLPELARCSLSPTDEAVFAVANPSGEIQLAKLGSMKGMASVHHLKSGSYLGRLWGNLSGKSSGPIGEAPTDLEICHMPNGTFVFAICRDYKLRMWSTSTFDCVMVEDLLAVASVDGASVQQGSQDNLIRKISGNPGAKEDETTLALFICLGQQRSQFCFVTPTLIDGQYQLRHRGTIYASNYDLVDYQANEQRLWALWTTTEGQPVLRYASLSSSSSTSPSSWTDAFLEEGVDPGFNPSTNLDARQTYTQQIFRPGRFSIQTLVKSVGIFKRSVSHKLRNDDYPSLDSLRNEVCAAVEAEIQQQVTDFDISAEDYALISHQAWARFYACALQYHQAAAKPLGLLVSGASGLVATIRKHGNSFLRPVDGLELVGLCGRDNISLPAAGLGLFRDTPMMRDDPGLEHDVVQLLKAAAHVSAAMPSDLVDAYEHALSRLAAPEQFAKKVIVKRLLDEAARDNEDTDDEAFVEVSQLLRSLSTCLQQVGDISRALEALLICLELDRGIVAHTAGIIADEEGEDGLLPDKDDFAASVGISILAESLNQMAHSRFELTRDLMVLQLLIVECTLSESVSSATAEQITSTFLPRTGVMSQCYYVLMWITETSATTPELSSLEQGMRQMAVLKINDSVHGQANLEKLARLARQQSGLMQLTLSELFLRGPGGSQARRLLTSDTDHTSSWYSVLGQLVSVAAQLLWPRCVLPVFQEFLLAACQHMQIQEYVRLLSTWCDSNCHSRQFLLGSALLHTGEPEKASDWVIQAAGGVPNDGFLVAQLFTRTEVAETPPERLQVKYFLKIVDLFEKFGYHDFVIELAKTALEVCDAEDPNRIALCYVLFSQHLKLGHTSDAYEAMVMNTDPTRRKDSLRQFVVTLFERRQLKELASYPYIDLMEELEQIVEARARSVDLKVNNYYDFLYSFHTTKGNYRKAAHVMFECGWRLGTELFTLDGMKRQAQCYLACINCLKLVEPEYTWIVKPSLRQNEPGSHLPPGVSPKRTSDGEELPLGFTSRPKMEVLELSQIEKEFELVCARLKLARVSSPSNLVGPGLSEQEIVALLAAANLYEPAVHICNLFDLEARPIVECLASKCVKLSRAGATERDAAWDWLVENERAGGGTRGGNSSTKENRLASAPVEAAWALLTSIVERMEKKGESRLHRALTVRLFSLGASLPAWLMTSYRKINPAELLRLQVTHGHLEPATKLAVEYLNAILGDGKEYFGLETSLNANNPSPVWFPANTIDQLLQELDFHSAQEPAYQKLQHQLNETVEKYLTAVERVSKDRALLLLR